VADVEVTLQVVIVGQGDGTTLVETATLEGVGQEHLGDSVRLTAPGLAELVAGMLDSRTRPVRDTPQA